MKYGTCDIKSMRIKSVGVNKNINSIITEDVVLEKNSPFYWNCVGRVVSIKHNTFLPTKEEAHSVIVTEQMNNPDKQNISCMYADYQNMVVYNVTRKEFKQLKKTYKQSCK